MEASVIFVFKNNDTFTPVIRVPINKAKHSTMDKLKQHLTDTVKLVGSNVRKVYTLDGKPVKAIEEFKNKGLYVACGDETFKRCNYPVPEGLGEGPASSAASMDDGSEAENKPVARPVKSALKKPTEVKAIVPSKVALARSTSSLAVSKGLGAKEPTIWVLRNGDAIHKPEKLILNHKRFKNMDAVYQKLDVLAPLAMGQIRKLCTLKGKPVKDFAEIEDGGVYIACGTELFSKTTKYQLPTFLTQKTSVDIERATEAPETEVEPDPATEDASAVVETENVVPMETTSVTETQVVATPDRTAGPAIDRSPAPATFVAEVTAAAVCAEAAVAAAEGEECTPLPQTRQEEQQKNDALAEAKLKYLAAEVAFLRKTVDEKERKIEELESAVVDESEGSDASSPVNKRKREADDDENSPSKRARSEDAKDVAFPHADEENVQLPVTTVHVHKYPTRARTKVISTTTTIHIQAPSIQIEPVSTRKRRGRSTYVATTSPSRLSPSHGVLRSPMAQICL